MESKEELIALCSPAGENQQGHSWLSLNGGSYNHVWKSNFQTPQALVEDESYTGPWVLKYPKPSDDPITDAMNDKNRAVRLWHEINADLPKAGLHKSGWVAPYIENTTDASDDEIAQKVVEIYRNTKRIVLDAATKGNFLKKQNTGQVVLVDVDLALKRRSSVASANFAENLNQRFSSYWMDLKLRASRPKTLEATRNLLYLEDRLTAAEIEKLCNDNQISLKNIQSLTWFRMNKMKLTYEVLMQVSVLNDLDVPLTDTLLETLCPDVDEPASEIHPVLKKARYGFFAHEEGERRVRNRFENSDRHESELIR